MNRLRPDAIERAAIIRDIHVMNTLSSTALSALLMPEQVSHESVSMAGDYVRTSAEHFTERIKKDFGEYKGYRLYLLTDSYMELIKNELDDKGAVTTYLSVQIEPEPSDPTITKRVDTYIEGTHTPTVASPTDDDVKLLASMLNHLAIINENLSSDL